MTKSPFDCGIATLSFDTEQIWGYVDIFGESQFLQKYPGAIEAHDRLLDRLTNANIRATWFVVGGMTLPGSQGRSDERMRGLPRSWVDRVPAGTERTSPLWYRRSFFDRLRQAAPQQEIGLHGGLAHIVWDHPGVNRQVAEHELAEGVKAMKEAGVTPLTFSHPRERERYHELLPRYGIRCYRSRTPTLAFRLGKSLPGAALRIADEMRGAAPPTVWPQRKLPGLWTVPASLFLYPIGRSRSRIAALRTRVQRFRKGIESAARHKGVFHYCFHPDNLTESPDGFSMLDDMLESLTRARTAGDVEICPMGDIATFMEHNHPETGR
jgi:peptidoglycan/xylan/chitin deacetylase (PgdA/CDA1 family)